MLLVVDANIIFSALIRDGKNAELLLNLYFDLCAPEFLLHEFETNKQELLDKTYRSAEEFDEIFILLQQVVKIVPKADFERFLEQAKNISPDPDDVAYFALAFKLGCPIWSNDKDLKEKQRIIKVYSTEDLLKLL